MLVDFTKFNYKSHDRYIFNCDRSDLSCTDKMKYLQHSIPMKKIILLAIASYMTFSLTACSEGAKDAASVSNTVDIRVLNWGPKETKVSTGFSVQSNGNSALWFEQRGIPHAGAAEVWFDQTALPGAVITPNVGGSAEVPPALIAKPGKYPVYLILKPQNQRVDLGTFEVLP
jgi:hypothetical protein